MKNLSIILLSAFAGAWLTMMLMRSCQVEPPLPEIQTVTDTLTIVKVDTVKIAAPQAVKIVRDTVKITDTILIAGQTFFQEIKEYQDSTYYAKISGINAFLEEIRVFPRTEYKYITTTERVYEKPRKWSIGIQGGIGITPKGLQPYLGVGVTRRLEF